jgi:hypothetical protein
MILHKSKLMNVAKQIFAISLILFTCLTSQASSALYLTENKLIDWIKENDAQTYKIYLDVAGHYKSRIVNKSEISLRATQPLDQHFFGWALIYNSNLNKFEHCQVENLFENRQMSVFCDLIENKQQIRKYYSGTTQNFIAESNSEEFGFKKEERAHLKTGMKVKIRALFTNGTALVEESNFTNHFIKGPSENANSWVVQLSDLEKN